MGCYKDQSDHAAQWARLTEEDPMRVLFMAYSVPGEKPLIGVYKRAIRVGLEMLERGHDVWMICPGRKGFRDELVLCANRKISFLDPPRSIEDLPTGELACRYYRMAFRRLAVDMVVIGEAPLGGQLRMATLAALQLGIRVVLLDNAYSPELARLFVGQWYMFDGIVLTGPSSFQLPDPPDYCLAVPPFVEPPSNEAERLLSDLPPFARLITVLGYDGKVVDFARKLLSELIELSEYDYRSVFLVSRPDQWSRDLKTLLHASFDRIRVLPLPSEGVLFGLVRRSDLVIGHCGFMQMSECLALQTPFLGINYPGCSGASFLPERAARFVHVANGAQPDKATVHAALQLLQTSREEMRGVHDGAFGAKAMVADFLETLSTSTHPNMRFKFTVARGC